MLSGKSGFQRIVWAFKNVLNHSVTWLFCDLKGPNDGTSPISTHQPIVKEARYQRESSQRVNVPVLPQELAEGQHEDATEVLEWLTLVMDRSPRIQHEDDIDSYLSRYRVPTDVEPDNKEGTVPQDLGIFRWRGLIHPAFVQSILLATLRASGNNWFALNVTAFDGKAYTFLQNKESTLTWEYGD